MGEIIGFGAFLYGMGILTGSLLGSALVYRRMVRRQKLLLRIVR